MGKINYSLLSLKKRIKSNQLVKLKRKLTIKVTKEIPTYDFIVYKLPIDSKRNKYKLLMNAYIPDGYYLMITVYNNSLQILNRCYLTGTGQITEYITCAFYQPDSNISLSFKFINPISNEVNPIIYHIMSISILSDINDYDIYENLVSTLTTQIHKTINFNDLNKILEFTVPLEHLLESLIQEYKLKNYHLRSQSYITTDVHSIIMGILSMVSYGNVHHHHHGNLNDKISDILWNICMYFGNNHKYLLSLYDLINENNDGNRADNIGAVAIDKTDKADKAEESDKKEYQKYTSKLENLQKELISYNELDDTNLLNKQYELQSLLNVKAKLHHEKESYKKNNTLIVYQKTLAEDIEKNIMVLGDFKVLMENEINTISMHLATAKTLKDINENYRTMYKILKGYYLRMGYDILQVDQQLSNYQIVYQYLQSNIEGAKTVSHKLKLYEIQIQSIKSKISEICDNIIHNRTRDQLQTLNIFKLLDEYLNYSIKRTFVKT